MATLIAQYPDDHEVVGEVRKDRIPCILPQVVFINCKILFASVVEEGKPGALRLLEVGFRMGDNVRDCGFATRRRLELNCGSCGGDDIIEGKPIEEEVSSFARNGDDWREPIRCRVFETSDVGDFSCAGSSRVRVLTRECN